MVTKMTLMLKSKYIIFFIFYSILLIFIIFDSVGFIFGIILSLAGICGLLLGSGLSLWLRKKIDWIDPVICGVGLLISVPLIFGALYILDKSVIWAFIIMFLGQVFLNMNWAIVVDISLVNILRIFIEMPCFGYIVSKE